jgi:ABC-2 type transport system ATP-binding protein
LKSGTKKYLQRQIFFKEEEDNMKKILEVKNIGKTYSSKTNPFKALDQISFDGYEGEVLGLLGPNGSGKTTIIKSIAALMEFDEGEIFINGKNNVKQRSKVLPDLGAVLDGNRNIYWRLTTLENINYFAGIKGINKNQVKDKIEKLLEMLKLNEIRNKEVRLLSRGMKQKVAIACSLIHEPSLILLDEPTLGLDVEISRDMEQWVRNFAKNKQKCILVTSHDMDFIEKVCDRVIIIQSGRIIYEGSVNEIKEKHDSIKKIQVTVNDRISENHVRSLKDICELDYEVIENKSILSFKLKNINFFHNILNFFNSNKIRLLNIQTMETEFEDIFMNIIKR